jgi:hypothetical protein
LAEDPARALKQGISWLVTTLINGDKLARVIKKGHDVIGKRFDGLNSLDAVSSALKRG